MPNLSKRYGQRYFANGFRARNRGEPNDGGSHDWSYGWDVADELIRLRAELAAERERARELESYTAEVEGIDELEAERARTRQAQANTAFMTRELKTATDRMLDFIKERDAALSNIDKLRKALEPFARVYENIFDGPNAEDIRRARAVLKETGGDNGNG